MKTRDDAALWKSYQFPLVEELSILASTVYPPQTTTFDASCRKFTTTYRGHALTVFLPQGYPNQGPNQGTVTIDVSPPHETVAVKCGKIIEDMEGRRSTFRNSRKCLEKLGIFGTPTPPGESMLIPLCALFRNVLDSTQQQTPPPENLTSSAGLRAPFFEKEAVNVRSWQRAPCPLAKGSSPCAQP